MESQWNDKNIKKKACDKAGLDFIED